MASEGPWPGRKQDTEDDILPVARGDDPAPGTSRSRTCGIVIAATNEPEGNSAVEAGGIAIQEGAVHRVASWRIAVPAAKRMSGTAKWQQFPAATPSAVVATSERAGDTAGDDGKHAGVVRTGPATERAIAAVAILLRHRRPRLRRRVYRRRGRGDVGVVLNRSAWSASENRWSITTHEVAIKPAAWNRATMGFHRGGLVPGTAHSDASRASPGPSGAARRVLSSATAGSAWSALGRPA